MSKGKVQKGYHLADTLSPSISGEVSQGITWQDGDKDNRRDSLWHTRPICDRDGSFGNGQESYSSFSSAHPKISPGEIVRIFKKYYCKGDIPKASGDQKRVMGWRILVGWILCCSCWWERELVKSGKLYTKTR